jgi:GNAT superfamily N-acetyltransferase
MEALKPCRTYCPCDECPYGTEKRDYSGDDSMCQICEFAKLLNRYATPADPQESEVLDILEAMLDVCDLDNPGPMFAGQHVRGGICKIMDDDAVKLRQYIADRRAAPENKPLELHFGDGKVGVSTCRPEKSETWNELLLWNPKMQQGVGNSIPIKDGTTTDDVEAYARLFFSNAESAQVVVDALNKIIDSYGGNKQLTLEHLRQMDKKYVRFVRYTPPKVESPDPQYENVKVDCLDESVISDDKYARLWFEDYGKTWLAYARKPCAEIGHESAENGSATVSGGAQDKLYREDENFIQTKFGYCFYTFDVPPIIYNLYVHPQYRRCGHSRELLKLVITEIRKSGYEGEIRIDAEPKENSIGLADLMKYYKSMGLTIRDARKPEGGNQQ